MKERVLIIGSGGHAKIVIDILELTKEYEIFGIVTNDDIESFCGYKVLGNDNVLGKLFKKGITKVAMGIGGFRNNNIRTIIFNKLKKINFDIINVIHPTAVISQSVSLGEGNVIFAGVIINSEVQIKNNCIVATGSSIDHETILNNHCLISAGVTIGAGAVLNQGVLCALGSNIISAITIGENVLVAAGATVVSSFWYTCKT